MEATTSAGQSKNIGSNSGVEEDPDMQRAIDLVDLHYGVKMNHMQGEDEGLRQARRDVDRVLEKLERKTNGGVMTRG